MSRKNMINGLIFFLNVSSPRSLYGDGADLGGRQESDEGDALPTLRMVGI
ncbi:hypothetical protein [Telmatospirillum sp.]|nr:hypothetical protein [Telmatospirillum sp.]MDR3438740.1 hypothetical protein [Telmatospirillum sp.]